MPATVFWAISQGNFWGTMSKGKAKPAAAEPAADAAPPPPKKKGKLIIAIVLPILLAGGGAGAWFMGLIPFGHKPHPHADAKPDPNAPPVYADLPEIIANLNVQGHRPSFVKLHAKLELARAEDQAKLTAAMPRVLDLFQTYLREMRPEELRGSEGTWRLREELINRVDVAAAPMQIRDVLFVELLIE